MGIKLVTPPEVEPISLDAAKKYLGVVDDEFDSIISALLTAAREFFEHETHRALVTQEWELSLDRFSPEIQLPKYPVRSITSVKYDDQEGIEQTLAPAAYTADLNSEPSWLVAGVDGWPTTINAVNAVRIRFVAGYPPTAASPPDLAGNVPETARQAIRQLLATWYENAEATGDANKSELPFALTKLISMHKLYL